MKIVMYLEPSLYFKHMISSQNVASNANEARSVFLSTKISGSRNRASNKNGVVSQLFKKKCSEIKIQLVISTG